MGSLLRLGLCAAALFSTLAARAETIDAEVCAGNPWCSGEASIPELKPLKLQMAQDNAKESLAACIERMRSSCRESGGNFSADPEWGNVSFPDVEDNQLPKIRVLRNFSCDVCGMKVVEEKGNSELKAGVTVDAALYKAASVGEKERPAGDAKAKTGRELLKPTLKKKKE